NLSAFFERRLHYRFQIGITQELVSQVELSIDLPFGTGRRLWHVLFYDHVRYAAGSAASVHPLNVPPKPSHRFYLFPRSDELVPVGNDLRHRGFTDTRNRLDLFFGHEEQSLWVIDRAV